VKQQIRIRMEDLEVNALTRLGPVTSVGTYRTRTRHLEMTPGQSGGTDGAAAVEGPESDEPTASRPRPTAASIPFRREIDRRPVDVPTAARVRTLSGPPSGCPSVPPDWPGRHLPGDRVRSCHVPTLVTGTSRVSALNLQVFHPYTDLLLTPGPASPTSAWATRGRRSSGPSADGAASRYGVPARREGKTIGRGDSPPRGRGEAGT